jgi:hypothetical protein
MRMRTACQRCREEPALPPAAAYAYLLGQYLGDGCISAHPRGVYALRIACCDAYPGVMRACEAAIESVRPGRVFMVPSQGCTYVTALWKHWPCLFPQHGPGRKHERPIVLEPWQREIVERYPGQFLRRLFHSDGCRVTNWTRRLVAGEMKRYEYPRYFFTNASTDIMGLCQWALGLLSIGWTMTSTRHLSVARKADVATLDEHVGPKS